MASTVQEILQCKISGTLTFEKRLEIKEKGRPKPLLDLKQTTKDRGKVINRYFKPSMYNISDWICGCNVKNAFFCFPCILFCSDDSLWTKTGVTDIKHLKEKVTKHASSTIHMNNAMNFSSLGRVDIRTQLSSAYRQSIKNYNDKVTQNRYILSKIIDCIKFCGSFELALRGHDETELSENPGIFRGLIDFVSELDGIFKEHLEKSTVFKGVSKTIQNELLESILAVTQEKIQHEVESARFVAIQADETTDCSNKTQFVFIVRYVMNGNIHERFWKFIEPKGTTAQALSNEIFAELAFLKIHEKPDKLIAQCYDGASVMSGNTAGVQTRIKTKYPSAHFVHCYAHQLNLVLQKAASQHKEVKIFFANLHAFSSFFGKSPKRTSVLDQVVNKRLPKSAPTRWYFNTRCIETVYTYKDDLINCLDEITDAEFDPVSINQAGALKNYLENETFLYWLKFFHSIMPHVDILFRQLQKSDIDAILIGKYIADFNSILQKIRDSIIDTNDNIDASSSKRKRPEDSKKRISLEICDIILSEIRCRFSFTEHLIVSRLFDTNKFACYKKDFPEDILKSVKNHYGIINVFKLKSELEVLYSREDFYNSAGAVAILQLLLEMNLGETFSESVKLLEILCTIPMTTVESERCFSTLKRIKTFLRNTMGESRLSALAMLSIEKPFIRSIFNFNELVIEHFSKQKDRRIDLIYKHVTT